MTLPPRPQQGRGFTLLELLVVIVIVGVLIGTYSSIYIASEAALALKVTPTDLLPPQPDKDEESGVMP